MELSVTLISAAFKTAFPGSPVGIGEHGVLRLPALGITGHAGHLPGITRIIVSAAELQRRGRASWGWSLTG